MTPRNLNHRTRLSTPITPTALRHESYAYDDSPSTFDVDDGDDGDIQDGWGDEAVLEWTGGAGDRHQATDSASSVAAEDAGISEEEEDWGRDAQMEWAWSPTQANLALSEADMVSEDTDEEEIEEIDELEDYAPPASQAVVVESKEQLVARGMPDYDEWELKRLQKLCNSFGYRPSTKHSALVKIATDCWCALNPPERAVFRAESASSEDIPLATKKAKVKTKTTTKVPAGTATMKTTKGKQKELVEQDVEEEFYRMIKDDSELYLRILRYEPISFDELVSKAIARGVAERGWKQKLKRWLDVEAITYFTEDPTGQRRRH